MDDKYVGLEGCEDLWELLRGIQQNKQLLQGWRYHFSEIDPGINDISVACDNALDLSEELFGQVSILYIHIFKSLQ